MDAQIATGLMLLNNLLVTAVHAVRSSLHVAGESTFLAQPSRIVGTSALAALEDHIEKVLGWWAHRIGLSSASVKNSAA